MKFLHSGKVKDVYDAGDGMLLFVFSDRVSAFDVKFRDMIPRKGEMLCAFAQYWFDRIPGPNHCIRRISADTMLVRKMEMIPMECVVRGYLYGSLMERFRRGAVSLPPGSDARLAAPLAEPVFDPTTKSEHDMPVDRQRAVADGLVTGELFDELQERSVSTYRTMSETAKKAGFVLADLKMEFGMDNGVVHLADSIGPDEYRLWPRDSYEPGRTQEAHDKQILRDWLVKNGWSERFERDRAAGRAPEPPTIPADVSHMMTARYVSSYEAFTAVP